MANWRFLPNPGREEEGLGHAGIETFKGAPYLGVARESAQNSLDAAARLPDELSAPVHLVFRRLLVKAEDIPGITEFTKTLKICREQAAARDVKKDKEFFNRAVSVVEGAHIAILSVEDYGTTGLFGPALPGNPFHALVKSSGISQKHNNDAGGSFGIGKNAAFAISSLRTVFYSTLYETDGESQHLTQGKSVLVSHEEETELHCRATGYWGAEAFMPVSDETLVPNWLRRSQVGTTVASVGFVEEADWHWQMAESIIRNFFSAIDKKAIHFTVQWTEENSLEISSDNIEDLFGLKEIRDAAENAGTMEDLDFSHAMLIALRSSESEVHTEEFKDVGSFSLTLLQQEQFPRRVGILRKGMYICDNLRHFGHAMARFSMSRDFVAILQPNDKQASSRVRDMESPRHDEISADRLDDLVERKKLKTAMKKVGDWARNTIKTATTKPAGPEILLDEMNRFFAKPSPGESIPDPANKNEDPEKTKFTPLVSATEPPMGAGKAGDSGSSGGVKSSKTTGGKTAGDRRGAGRGAAGGRGGKAIPFSQLRNSKSPDGRTRTISFTPGATGRAKLEIAAVGLATDEALTVLKIDGGTSAKAPTVDVEEGVRKTIALELEPPYHGPISVVLSAIEDMSDAH